MANILIVMLSDHLPKRAIETAVVSAGEDGEVFFLRIFPVVVTQGFAEIEDHGAGADQKRSNDARNILDQCTEYARNEWKGNRPKISYMMREGAPIDIASDFVEFTKVDLIIIPEKDSQRLGSFASGDLVASLRKKTGVPLRVVS